MPRPIFIIAEPEPEQALSARKLVIETAKFNVITAHSAKEMFETLDLFPKVDAVILHAGLDGNPQQLVQQIRAKTPETPVVLLAPSPNAGKGADHVISSHDPQELVLLLRELFGDPRRDA